MIQDFLSGGGGVQARRPEYRIRTWNQYARTHARARTHAPPTHTHIHTYIRTYRQTHEADGWTYMYMYRRQTKRQFILTCIIMYRENVRNRHVRACRGIHARLIILKFPMKMNDLVPSSPTYFIFIGYLKTGGMEGVRANPMKSNWIRHCLYMHANAQTFWLHYA